MAIERKSADQIHGYGTRAEAERHCDQDVLIRSGLCPNGHGLMETVDRVQHCPVCKFFTNVKQELVKS
jgi:hypothetical protein